MSKVNSFDDLNRNYHFVIKSTVYITLTNHTAYLDINELNLRWAKSVEDAVLKWSIVYFVLLPETEEVKECLESPQSPLL